VSVVHLTITATPDAPTWNLVNLIEALDIALHLPLLAKKTTKRWPKKELSSISTTSCRW
jgi:hypothetical protein